MTTRRLELTEQARAGYEGNENRYLPTSPSYYAHALGAYMRQSGRTVPVDVRMGRGYSIRANNMRFMIKDTKLPNGKIQSTFERVE